MQQPLPGPSRREFLGGLASLAAAAPVDTGGQDASLTASDFGLVPASDDDQSEAFLRLRAALWARGADHCRVTFAPGTYRYGNNRWLLGVRSVTLDAAGVTFQNISASPSGQNSCPFNVNSFFQDIGDRPWPGKLVYQAGYLLRSAAAGSTEVELEQLSDAVAVAAGARVLIHSFDQQFYGFPPNPRFFEWHQVAAVDTATGRIGLERPLRCTHDATLRDTVYDAAGLVIGRPRLLPLDRALFTYPDRLELIGASFARNPNARPGASNGLSLGADTLLVQDCTHDGAVWPSGNRIATYERCRLASVEIDKICDRVTFRSCTVGDRIRAATGVNDVLIENCDIWGYIGISPRRARLVGNTIRTGADDPWGAIRTYYGNWPVAQLECVGNTVLAGGPLHFAIATGKLRQLVASGRGAANEILLDDTAVNRKEVIVPLAAGARVQLEGSSEVATVTAMGWTGEQWYLKGDWAQTVVPGQVWTFCNLQAIGESGTQLVGSPQPTALLSQLHPVQRSYRPL